MTQDQLNQLKAELQRIGDLLEQILNLLHNRV